MEQVQFEGNNGTATPVPAKNSKQAVMIMTIIIIVCLLLTVYINISVFAPNLLRFGGQQNAPASYDSFREGVPMVNGEPVADY